MLDMLDVLEGTFIFVHNEDSGRKIFHRRKKRWCRLSIVRFLYSWVYFFIIYEPAVKDTKCNFKISLSARMRNVVELHMLLYLQRLPDSYSRKKQRKKYVLFCLTYFVNSSSLLKGYMPTLNKRHANLSSQVCRSEGSWLINYFCLHLIT